MYCMDRLDRKILSVLQANARASLQEIGLAVVSGDAKFWKTSQKVRELSGAKRAGMNAPERGA